MLTVAAFRQMCGRAGRLGLDDEGEAVLMLPNGSRASRELAVHLVTADMPPLLSSLQVSLAQIVLFFVVPILIVLSDAQKLIY